MGVRLHGVVTATAMDCRFWIGDFVEGVKEEIAPRLNKPGMYKKTKG